MGELCLANELQLKGLTDGIANNKNQIDIDQLKFPAKIFRNDVEVYQALKTENQFSDSSNIVDELERKNTTFPDRTKSVDEYVDTQVVTVDGEDLDKTIEKMMTKIDGVWTCSVCGKNTKSKTHL